VRRAAAPAAHSGARRLSYGSSAPRDTSAAAKWKVRSAILEAVSELIEELDGIQQQISEQALEHVHSNEVILTFGYCRTVHLFLREAAKKRQFQVVVAEGAPAYEGQKLARDLAADGINTTCITDSAVFAMMARANMVVIGAHAVLANGGMLGMVRRAACAAARAPRVPPRVRRVRSLRFPLRCAVRVACGCAGGVAARGAFRRADGAAQAVAAIPARP